MKSEISGRALFSNPEASARTPVQGKGMEISAAAALKQTIAEIQKGKVLPVYLILGDENYVTKDAARQVIEAAELLGKG